MISGLLDNRNMATITPYTIIQLSFTAPSHIATLSSVSQFFISLIPFSPCWHFTILLLTIPMDTTIAECKWTQHESSAKSSPLMSSECVWSWLYPGHEQLWAQCDKSFNNKADTPSGLKKAIYSALKALRVAGMYHYDSLFTCVLPQYFIFLFCVQNF